MSVPRQTVAVALAVGLIAPVLAAAQRQVPGAFRGRVVLVPVDVRVLDRSGNPVTDLTRDDFTIFEDNVPQALGHFSTQAFTAAAPDPDSVPLLRRGPGLESTPLTHRTLLIVLGRGRLEGPSRGMTGIIDMVRTRLLPQDQVGVIAYNKVYGLTTDHASVIRLLESYRERHEAIETGLGMRFSGLQILSGPVHMSPRQRSAVDELFAAAGLTGRELAAGAYGEDAFDEHRRALAQRLEVDLRERRGLGLLDELDFASRNPLMQLLAAREGFDDIRNLFVGVELLRYLEGEKHLVFLTEYGLMLPGRTLESGGLYRGIETKRQYLDFAKLAADARVAVSPVQTGGLLDGFTVNGDMTHLAEQGFVAIDNRTVAEETGGLSFFYEYSDRALSQVDRATRFQYLIGYYPANPDWDGSFRRIRVEVNRPGVTVHNRGGYFANEELVPYDRRAFMSHTRIMAAATDFRAFRQIGVTMSEPRITGSGDDRTLEVDLQIDARDLEFFDIGGEQVAALQVAAFVGSRGQDLLGEQSDVVDLRLGAEPYARLQREGFTHTIRVAFTGTPRHLKTVVYDYHGDRLGTAEQRIR
jgi:VWFA-related protein